MNDDLKEPAPSPDREKIGDPCKRCGLPYDDCTQRIVTTGEGACCSVCVITDSHNERYGFEQTDREKLIAKLRQFAEKQAMDFDSPEVARWLNECADALAAQPVLDREKVAKVVHDVLPDDNSAGEYADFGRCKHGPDTACVTIARALCEAAERGELS